MVTFPKPKSNYHAQISTQEEDNLSFFKFFKTFIWKVETWPLEDNTDSSGMLAIQLKSTEKSNLCLKFICSFFLVNSL